MLAKNVNFFDLCLESGVRTYRAVWLFQRASQVVHWLRICLLMHETWV